MSAVDREVASPCISVCVVYEPAHLCIGCFRTLDEIAAWSAMGRDERLAVLDRLPQRRAAMGLAVEDNEANADAGR